MSTGKIPENAVNGIAEALHHYAPELVPSLLEIMRNGTPERLPPKLGQSIHATLYATVPWPLGEPILRALESIEKEHGFETKFSGCQVNYLVMCWRAFAEPRQLPPQQ